MRLNLLGPSRLGAQKPKVQNNLLDVQLPLNFGLE